MKHFDVPGRKCRYDRGAATIEYVGLIIAVVVLVVGVAAVVSTTSLDVVDKLKSAICSITGGTDCADATVAEDGTPQQPGTKWPEPTETRPGGHRKPIYHLTPGLGEPVPGKSVPTPNPPPWSPVDEGAGKHNSSGRLKKAAAYLELPDYYRIAWEANVAVPEASRNLRWYLENSGKDLPQDVDKILRDVPRLNRDYTTEQADLGMSAIADAKERGATGPMTFPVSTAWSPFSIGARESPNWYLAIGHLQYSMVGQVTVYPPSTAGGEWTYEMTTSMIIRKQYNWDKGKSFYGVPADSLGWLHRAGVAQEYLLTGESAVTTRKGP